MTAGRDADIRGLGSLSLFFAGLVAGATLAWAFAQARRPQAEADRLLDALAKAPDEDEELDEDERTAMAEGLAAAQAGQWTPYADVQQRLRAST